MTSFDELDQLEAEVQKIPEDTVEAYSDKVRMKAELLSIQVLERKLADIEATS